jgi:hypothetical protein
MFPCTMTKDPAAVEREARGAFLAVFPDADSSVVPRAFAWTLESFAGHYGDYQPIDARYHDLEHTLQATLCMARLLQARHAAGAQPTLTPRLFELGLLAILLHDTGYLKKRGDTEGTGAKYTVVHVDRSADFAAQLLADKGFGATEIQAVRNMIHCTGVNARPSLIAFQSPAEKMLGCALGTADLLGQMAADDYIEKLPALFDEFAEAARFTNDQSEFVANFTSAQDLLRKTPLFWDQFVLPKLASDFGGLYRFLNDPYPAGPNEYLLRIQANILRLKAQLAAQTP